MFPERLETERVTRFMPWEPHATLEESYEFVERIERRWSDHERTNPAPASSRATLP